MTAHEKLAEDDVRIGRTTSLPERKEKEGKEAEGGGNLGGREALVLLPLHQREGRD